MHKLFVLSLFLVNPLLWGKETDNASLQGKWARSFETTEGCDLDVLEFKGSSFVKSSSHYSDKKCKNLRNNFSEHGDFAVTAPGKITFHLKKTTMTMGSDAEVKAANSHKLCGLKNWVLNKARDTTSAVCADGPALVAKVRYDIFKIADNKFFLGNKSERDGRTSKTRPTAFDDALSAYTRVQSNKLPTPTPLDPAFAEAEARANASGMSKTELEKLLKELATIDAVVACTVLDAKGNCPIESETDRFDISAGKLFVTVYPSSKGSQISFTIQMRDGVVEDVPPIFKSEQLTMKATDKPLTRVFKVVPSSLDFSHDYYLHATAADQNSAKGMSLMFCAGKCN